ncbi:hypothetical protein PMIN03_000399 [Paraphaeosphaeria minitans]
MSKQKQRADLEAIHSLSSHLPYPRTSQRPGKLLVDRLAHRHCTWCGKPSHIDLASLSAVKLSHVTELWKPEGSGEIKTLDPKSNSKTSDPSLLSRGLEVHMAVIELRSLANSNLAWDTVQCPY